MANQQQLTALLQKFADDNISKEEYTALISYFNLTGNDEEVFAAMDQIWKNTTAEVWHTEEEADHFYQKLIHHQEFNTTDYPAPTRKLWYRIVVAAAVLVTLSAGLYFYTDRELAPASERFAQHDLRPGGNRAILTLSDGRTIDLSDAGNGELAKESGISVTKTKTGQLVYTVNGTGKNGAQTKSNANAYNTITTPRGGEYKVNLPDGTTVWMNAASSLKFPVQFNGQQRKVNLNGEAYFEVAKMMTKQVIKGKQVTARLPFIVETEKQDVQVLGTHFNVNAYAEEAATKTTLLEGAISVSLRSTPNNIHSETYELRPGQQATLNGSSIKVVAADMEEAMAWKNGLFMFSGQDLEGIMKQVERWYDVDVVFSDNSLKTQTFKGTISRFKKISQLLEVLESTGSVHFTMEGRRIMAMK